jgi:DNA-binding MarR family transcriptional regulator
MSNAAVMFHTAVAQRLGLGASESKALDLLDRHGPLTAGELVEHSGLAPASVTGIVDRLQKRGLVRRRRDPRDGRRVIVELDREALGETRVLFEGLTRRLTELYERYEDEELELLLDFLREVTERQREATAELTADGPERR